MIEWEWMRYTGAGCMVELPRKWGVGSMREVKRREKIDAYFAWIVGSVV
jgi:hypothetical protein